MHIYLYINQKEFARLGYIVIIPKTEEVVWLKKMLSVSTGTHLAMKHKKTFNLKINPTSYAIPKAQVVLNFNES